MLVVFCMDLFCRFDRINMKTWDIIENEFKDNRESDVVIKKK